MTLVAVNLAAFILALAAWTAVVAVAVWVITRRA